MTPADRDNERRELLDAIDASESDRFFQSAEGFIEPLTRDLADLLVSQVDAELLKAVAPVPSEHRVNDRRSSDQTAEGITFRFDADDAWGSLGDAARLARREEPETKS